MFTVEDAARLAHDAVGDLHPRWEHLSAVGACAERLAERSELVTNDVVVSAWLHDVGYGPAQKVTGFHPLDGATYLQRLGATPEVVRLVAWHTGAGFEAEARGLADDLATFQAPDSRALDVLTMIDLSISPKGEPVQDVDRVAEILCRYEDGDPVHEAVSRSRPHLLASSSRGKALLGLPKNWPVIPS